MKYRLERGGHLLLACKLRGPPQSDMYVSFPFSNFRNSLITSPSPKATVVMTCNLALLAIPTLIADKPLVKGTVASDAAMLASYVSVVFCAGSLVTGLSLLTEYRKKEEWAPCVIVCFMVPSSSLG